MKKFLISILAILLGILTYFIVFNNIPIGNWKNKNINDIKNLNAKLDEQIDIAKQLNNQEYLTSKDNLELAIKNLKIAKEKYQSKVSYLANNVELGVVKIKYYKIERLWITLENYAKKENVELKMDVRGDSTTEGVYDLDITLVGDYIGITDFIYRIEKDDTLGFKILNFKMLPNSMASTTQENTTTTNSVANAATNEVQREEVPNVDKYVNSNNSVTTSGDTSKLRATFKIEGVGIEFN